MAKISKLEGVCGLRAKEHFPIFYGSLGKKCLGIDYDEGSMVLGDSSKIYCISPPTRKEWMRYPIKSFHNGCIIWKAIMKEFPLIGDLLARKLAPRQNW